MTFQRQDPVAKVCSFSSSPLQHHVSAIALFADSIGTGTLKRDPCEAQESLQGGKSCAAGSRWRLLEAVGAAIQ